MRILYWGLYRVRQVQELLDERAYADVGEKCQHDQKNRGEISPGELRCSDMCNPIRVYISPTRHMGHGRRVRESGENDLGNLFASSFLRKDENPLIHRTRSKYNSGQEICTGTSESSDIIKGEILKLLVGERGTGLGRDRVGGFLQWQPPTDARGRKT